MFGFNSIKRPVQETRPGQVLVKPRLVPDYKVRLQYRAEMTKLRLSVEAGKARRKGLELLQASAESIKQDQRASHPADIAKEKDL